MKDANTCYMCGESNLAALENHHIVPDRYNGSDEPENMVTLCGSCHNKIENELYTERFYKGLGLDEPASVQSTAHEGGKVIEPHESLDRQIPEESKHIRVRKRNGGKMLHCGYCHTVFTRNQHSDLAQHLRVRHGVEDVYTTMAFKQMDAIVGDWKKPGDQNNE